MPQNNTTRRKSLTEAAIDVLQASAKQGQDPMQSGPYPTSYDGMGVKADPLSAVVDLGGATTQDPSGGPIGAKASAVRHQMSQPQQVKTGKPHAGGEEEVLEPGTSSPSAGLPNSVKAAVNPTMATPSGQAPITTPDTREGWPVNNEQVELSAEEIAEAKKNRLNSIIEMLRSQSVDEDMNAMFAGSTLTEDFRHKAKTIFETAVVNRAVMVVEQLEEEILQASEEAVSEIKEDLEDKIDAYLDHVVENWMVENQVAIESGLKTEITEQFIGGLRNLFLENYMEIPDNEVNVVESLATEVESLNKKLNETLNNNIALNKQINESKQRDVLAKACNGLTAVQADKLSKLAESVEFTSESEYASKLAIIREGYSKVNSTAATTNPEMIVETVSSAPTPVEVEKTIDPSMKAYADAIRRTRFK